MIERDFDPTLRSGDGQQRSPRARPREREPARSPLATADSPVTAQIERLKRAMSVDYTGRINTSLAVLGELWAELAPASRSRLRVAVLTDHLTPPGHCCRQRTAP